MAGLSPRSQRSAPSPEKPGDKEDNVADHQRDVNGNDNDFEDDCRKNKNNFSFATKKYLMKYGLMNERSVSFVIPDDKNGETKLKGKDGRSAPDDDSLTNDSQTTSASPLSNSRRPNNVLDMRKIQHLPNLT